MTRYEKLKEYMLDKLKKGLPPIFTYHGFDHVMDVMEAAERIGKSEGLSEEDMELLRVAVLFHDSGFMVNPKGHEEIGCDMAEKELPDFGYVKYEIAKICGMIRATKYPHHPAGKMEEIICDADLDYLGRDDFFEIGNKLYRELKARKILNTEEEWNRLQVNFLASHHYFTPTALQTRNEKKQENVEKVRRLIN